MRAVALSFVVCLSGCSFALMERAPRPVQPGQVPWCTASPGAAILDGLAVLGYGINSIRIMSEVSSNHQKLEGTDAAQVLTGIAMILVHGASGTYGLIQQRRCSEARRRFEADLAATRAVPVTPPSPSGSGAGSD